MAAFGSTPISLYYSPTATSVPLAANLVSGELAINTIDGKLFYKDSSGVVQTIASNNSNAGVFVGTGAVTVPAGTTVQQPASPTIGMLRYNTTTSQFEGYGGVSPAWGGIGSGGSGGGSVVSTNGLIINNMSILTSYSIPSGYSASSVGPMVVSGGAVITIPSGSRWVIL